METNKICPNCRKPLPPDVPLGLCPECLIKSGFPTEGVGGVSGEAAGSRFVPPPVEEIARLFPQLEILGLIGKGGMGAVYKARQPALDRFVALKVLPPAVGSDPGFAERFNREARALARLNHPNIVAVHDFGKAGPLHYLVMEFVDGANLREVEHAGKLSPEQALAIVPQICEALQFAHNEGIVHRDIKPENLLLDKRGRVKITDFGIAKIIGQPAGKAALTGAKDVVGTPHYMAPEQIERPQAVDHRADIYSLGVVFYEMLTGELPLGKFAPPSSRMGGIQVDVRLDEVVLHTLEKEPERRYQHVNQLKTDVETIAGVATPGAGGLAARGGTLPPAFLHAAGRTASDKALLPALLLAVPFGLFGAHRFYVGKFRSAAAQLGAFAGCVLLIIACATTGGRWQPALGIVLGFSVFGCFIWAIIDWLLILCKAFTDGQGKRMTHWLHPHNGDLKAGPGPLAGPPPGPPLAGAAPSDGIAPPPPTPAPGNPPAGGTGLITAPAVGLMVAGLWKLLSALAALSFVSGSGGWLEPLLGEFGMGSIPGFAGVGLLLFKVVPALFILFGAFQMLQLRSYAWSVAAAILAMVSCSLIGLPMGIWALIVLARQDVRDTFARAAVSPAPGAARWPWFLAAAVVVMMVAAVLIAGIMLLREVVGDKSVFRGKPGAAARGVKSSGSSTPGAAIPGQAPALEDAAPAPALPPVRIRAGSSERFTDSDGNAWLPDQGFADGETTERSDNLAIANSKDPALYRAERYGMTSFSYPVPNGKYLVKLHFAETYNAITGPGGRVFTFIIEGHEFKDFDVWARAGGAQRAVVETVNVEVTDGKLNISFTPQQEKPEINAIEILPEPRVSAGPAAPPIPPAPTVPAMPPVPAIPAAPAMPAVPAVPPVPAVQPAPPAAAATAAVPPSPLSAGTPVKPYAYPEKTVGNLSTSDPFQEDFSRTLPLSAHGRIRLDNVNGQVEIAGWDRSDVVIKALKHGKNQGSFEAAKIDVAASADEISIHTRQPSGDKNLTGMWSLLKNTGNSDATVDYAIQVPHHARLANISSVNGRIAIEAISGDIDASSVNGTLQVRGAAGSLKLSTVNGRMVAELVSLGRGQSVSLDSVNGSIEATLPADAQAKVTANTLNGGLSSDFPALVVKKEFPVSKKLNGTLGNGGASVKASTVNGAIRFRKGPAAE
jgi:serine/threonine protein kinase